jgi:hypothetical protein
MSSEEFIVFRVFYDTKEKAKKSRDTGLRAVTSLNPHLMLGWLHQALIA